MGDNRGGSNDSRRMGPFKKSQIDAKVLALTFLNIIAGKRF